MTGYSELINSVHLSLGKIVACRKSALIRFSRRQPKEAIPLLSLDYGNNGEQDFDQAAAWYAKAADQGHKSAAINLLLQHVLGKPTHCNP
jgi:hypothetical protein